MEKNIVDDSDINRLFIDLYYDFKRRNGYTETEISRKRVALENVLIPYTVNEHRSLLRQAGFVKISSFFQWYNFSGMIGVKNG